MITIINDSLKASLSVTLHLSNGNHINIKDAEYLEKSQILLCTATGGNSKFAIPLSSLAYVETNEVI